MNYTIIDNFLTNEDANNIENILLSHDFEWYFNKYKAIEDGKISPEERLDNWQFVHTLYRDCKPSSYWYDKIVLPFYEKIKPWSWLKVKANLNPRTDKIIEYGWHNDYLLDNHKTAVYYVNTNNGKTLLEGGVEIESIKNRLVYFDCKIKHTATSTTNVKARSVINLNFLPNKNLTGEQK